MKINAYVIYDVKAKMYNKPFYLQNDDVALRAFTDLANDPNTDVSKHPADFILFSVGTYEDTTAEIDATIPEVMARAHELKKNPEEIKNES
jgi:hypothetical protein